VTYESLPQINPAVYATSGSIAEERTAYDEIEFLPFVGIDKDSKLPDFWISHATGDYAFDWWLGEQYARALLPVLRMAVGGSHVLVQIILAISGKSDGESDRVVIAGMMRVISDALCRPAGLTVVRSAPEMIA